MGVLLPLYLDYHATTPVDLRVFEAMRPYFTEIFGNPASGTHSFGWRAEAAVVQARGQVARLINAPDPKEIVWTSGTTESINLALVGVATATRESGNRIVSCVTEHRAVLETLKHLGSLGFEIVLLSVDSKGRIDPDQVQAAINDRTILISLMAANNEIGTIPPIAAIGKIAKQRGVFFHVDAAQGCGKIPIDVEAMGIDLLSMSAHKVYGPKGVGALYVRRRRPNVRLTPLIHGGGHEGGLRAGTLPVPNIVGMGKAFEIAGEEMAEEGRRLQRLRDRLYQGLCKTLSDVVLNGPDWSDGKGVPSGRPAGAPAGELGGRLPGNLNVSFLGVSSGDLMAKLNDIAVSSGAACTTGSLEPSYVIRALGVGDDRARSSIRFGLGRFTTEEEIDYAIERVSQLVQQLRSGGSCQGVTLQTP